MSCSGRTTWWTPIWVRIRACDVLIAFAQTFLIPSSSSSEAVRMLASRSVPIAEHGPVELVDRQLPHRLLVGGVGLDRRG